MNYAIRNTIILLVSVVLFGGGGWAFITWLHSGPIEELKYNTEQLEIEASGYRSAVADYESVVRKIAEVRYRRENYPKSFFPTSSASDVYDFLIRLNQDHAFTELNFSYQDSTIHDEYGIMTTSINGTGNYRNLINFLNRIETGEIINKVTSLQIQAVNQLERLSYISFNITLQTYYARQPEIPRGTITGSSSTTAIARNPFFPLIHAVRPVEEDEINIEDSRMIAISRNNTWLIDQNSNLRSLAIGDEVYLGTLVQINTDEGTAEFRLNRGGIIDRVTKHIRN